MLVYIPSQPAKRWRIGCDISQFPLNSLHRSSKTTCNRTWTWRGNWLWRRRGRSIWCRRRLRGIPVFGIVGLGWALAWRLRGGCTVAGGRVGKLLRWCCRAVRRICLVPLGSTRLCWGCCRLSFSLGHGWLRKKEWQLRHRFLSFQNIRNTNTAIS